LNALFCGSIQKKKGILCKYFVCFFLVAQMGRGEKSKKQQQQEPHRWEERKKEAKRGIALKEIALFSAQRF
jgi:hypothetical protein